MADYCSPSSVRSKSSDSPMPPDTDNESLDGTSSSSSARKLCVNYSVFFHLPDKRPSASSKCLARCKLCQKQYKYTLTSKGNLLKHLEATHLKQLNNHREQQRKKNLENARSSDDGQQCTLSSTGSVVTRPRVPFKNQSKVLTSIVKNLCGRGGLPLNIVEQPWFRNFMKDVEPKFEHTSRMAVSSRLDELYKQEKKRLINELKESGVQPSLTVDFWTGCNAKSYMGATIHYVNDGRLKSQVLYFIEVKPPHSSQIIKDHFEIQLDNHNISCFQVVTDNAANMKHAFELMLEDDHEDMNSAGGNHQDEMDGGDCDDSANDVEWTTVPLTIEGWIGCNAHLVQLVVHDGCKELRGYPRIRTILSRAQAIACLSRRSSHFSYAFKIPIPCDTRWNSNFKLYDHILKHMETINDALKSVNRDDLVITKPQFDILLLITKILGFFSEATNILQQDAVPTSNQVIPVVDSLENALLQANRDNSAVNAFCEALLTSLRRRFGFLLTSKLFQAATALDPSVKLSFTGCHPEGSKYFIFSSIDVIQAINSLLPSSDGQSSASSSISQDFVHPNPTKKRKLMDFSSISGDAEYTSHANNTTTTELQAYFDQPRLSNDVDMLSFWAQRRSLKLSCLALQLLSVPCSSAPVERLFSKAGIILSKRRSRLSNEKLEKLLFLKC